MLMKLRDRIKLKKRLKLQGKTSFSESVGHALDGVEYTVNHERNFKIEILFAILVSIAAFVLKVSLVEWCVLVLTMAVVLSLEIINTAIERSIDLVTKDYKELAKIAKDAAAGAVLIMSMFSVIIGIIIFLPKIIVFIQ